MADESRLIIPVMDEHVRRAVLNGFLRSMGELHSLDDTLFDYLTDEELCLLIRYRRELQNLYDRVSGRMGEQILDNMRRVNGWKRWGIKSLHQSLEDPGEISRQVEQWMVFTYTRSRMIESRKVIENGFTEFN